jgi:hypothetical protein
MIKLLALTPKKSYGANKGKEVYQKLLLVFEENCEHRIFKISMKGIEEADVSFLRESIVAIAKQYLAEKAIYIVDLKNQDIIDNLNCACTVKNQPLILWDNDDYKILGKKITDVTRKLIDLVVVNAPITSVKVSEKLDISTANASVKLNKLFKSGYIFRSENVATTGGIEFHFTAIK